MKKLVAVLAALFIGVTACKKEAVNSAEKSTIANGSLSGIISPANAALSLNVVSENDLAFNSTLQLNSNSGDFSLKELKPGRYRISLAVNYGFSPLAPDRIVEIKPGINTDLGVFTFTASGTANAYTPSDADPTKSYSLSHKLNGNFVGHPASATLTGTDLTITGSTSEGKYMSIGYYTFETTIVVKGITTPGNYPATVNYVTTKGTIGFRTWGTVPQGGSATVVITALDVANKKVSGTFTGKLVPVSGTSGDLNLTEGKFNVVYR